MPMGSMKQTLLLGVIGVAFAGFFGYHGIYARQQAQVRVIEQQIAQEQANQQAQTDVAALVQQIERYRKHLPPEPDASWLVHEVVALAKKANVPLASITEEAPQSLQQFTRLAVNLQFTASYHQLGAFIDDLERANRFMRIERLEMTRSLEGEEPVSIRMVLSTIHIPSGLPGGGS